MKRTNGIGTTGTAGNVAAAVLALIVVVVALALPAFMMTGCAKNTTAQDKGTEVSDIVHRSSDSVGRVDRGKYLVTIAGCNDCHTPWVDGPEGPHPDMSRMLSGHPEDLPVTTPAKLDGPWLSAGNATNTAFSGPWGISYTMNLTPDSLTGIGVWTEEIFINTIRSGKHWGASRPIMPPMPWQMYRNMTDEDLKSVYAFLRTIPPIRNQPPAYLPPSGPPTAAK